MRLVLTAAVLAASSLASLAHAACNSPLLDKTEKLLLGKAENLCEAYAGKVVLVVNTASQCGYTPQYEGLEALYKSYKDKGLVVLGFPSDQFGGQEFADDKEIAKFCKANFGVSFPMFAKVKVNGEDAHPLYKHLKSEATGLLGTEGIKWNFTKFLVGKDGRVVKRYGSMDKPEDIAKDVEKLL